MYLACGCIYNNVMLMCDLLYIFNVDELIIQGELFSVKKKSKLHIALMVGPNCDSL